jgi:hypothetical protein
VRTQCVDVLGAVFQPRQEGDGSVLRCRGVQRRGAASQVAGPSEETGGQKVRVPEGRVPLP